MRAPEFHPTISLGQALLAALLATIIGGGYWISTKDRNDQELSAQMAQQAKAATEQNADLKAQIANVAGKVDGFNANMNTLANGYQLLQQRVQTLEVDAKDARTDGATFQRNTDQHVNEVDARLRVIEAYRPPR